MSRPFRAIATSWLKDYWIRVQASYWFLPSLMTAGAIVLASALVAVDVHLEGRWGGGLAWITVNQPDGARSLLATVAGSMITAASITFSMTLLMVSFASGQIGPRLIQGFLRDRGSQVVLGTFIATFIYCLVVLRTIHAADEGRPDSAAFVPHLSVIVGVVLALVGVAVLIYFIHHVPMRINVSHVISLLGTDLLQQLEKEFPEELETALRADLDTGRYPRPPAKEDSSVVCLDGVGGYLRIVDHDQLLGIACRADRCFEVLRMPGDFCFDGAELVRVYGGPLEDEDIADVRRQFSWGGERTPEQDILFRVEQLAEVTGKALSPGVNDQYTALSCIDQMERLIVAAAKRREPDAARYVDGHRRLIVRFATRTEIVDRYLLPVRQFSLGDLLTTDRVLAMLAACMRRYPPGSPVHETLRVHYVAIRDDAPAALPSASQRALIAARCAEHERAPLARPPTALRGSGP